VHLPTSECLICEFGSGSHFSTLQVLYMFVTGFAMLF